MLFVVDVVCVVIDVVLIMVGFKREIWKFIKDNKILGLDLYLVRYYCIVCVENLCIYVLKWILLFNFLIVSLWIF